MVARSGEVIERGEAPGNQLAGGIQQPQPWGGLDLADASDGVWACTAAAFTWLRASGGAVKMSS